MVSCLRYGVAEDIYSRDSWSVYFYVALCMYLSARTCVSMILTSISGPGWTYLSTRAPDKSVLL